MTPGKTTLPYVFLRTTHGAHHDKTGPHARARARTASVAQTCRPRRSPLCWFPHVAPFSRSDAPRADTRASWTWVHLWQAGTHRSLPENPRKARRHAEGTAIMSEGHISPSHPLRVTPVTLAAR